MPGPGVTADTFSPSRLVEGADHFLQKRPGCLPYGESLRDEGILLRTLAEPLFEAATSVYAGRYDGHRRRRSHGEQSARSR
jgi:hypothetical protein